MLFPQGRTSQKTRDYIPHIQKIPAAFLHRVPVLAACHHLPLVIVVVPLVVVVMKLQAELIVPVLLLTPLKWMTPYAIFATSKM